MYVTSGGFLQEACLLVLFPEMNEPTSQKQYYSAAVGGSRLQRGRRPAMIRNGTTKCRAFRYSNTTTRLLKAYGTY